jgi:hypothetical protein
MNHGPYVTRLIMQCISREAIPIGGGIADGIKFFTDESHRKDVMQRAETIALKFVEAIKKAPDNPYGTDNEVIAKALLDKLPKMR